MANPNFVCTLCSQTFTRRWRGTVHNNNTHAGLAKIVRLIDYMIGRNNGEYLPSDPSLYRRKKRSRSSTEYLVQSNFADPYSSFRELNKEKLSLLDKGIEHYSQPYGASSGPDRNQKYYTSDSKTVSDPIQQINEGIVKMAEIKRLMSKYCTPKMVQDTLSEARECCKIMGDNRPLDKCIEEAHKLVKVIEARNYLNSP
jgi:hypothetical protein